MVREVDLVSYLPPYLADYREVNITLAAENPEFHLVWRAADRILYNEFIATADEDGISRFEQMLGILSSRADTLENRRARVQNRWVTALPYTMKMLLKKLQIICGDTDFELLDNFGEGYTLILHTNLEGFGKVDEVEDTLGAMVPCNIQLVSRNEINSDVDGCGYFAGIVSFAQVITILEE